jgi:hypothetical protein
MAMSVTITEERVGTVKKIKFEIVSAADGSASGTTTYAYDGAVLRFVTVPDGGATQPTDNFDIVLNDADGYDILAGQGANRSNAAASTVVASMGAVATDKISLAASNMGDSKGATLYLYIR